MNILIIAGSPRKRGTTNRLMLSFIKGAESVGHTVKVFDAAHANIAPCRGCYGCVRKGQNRCVMQDDMNVLYGDDGLIVWADAIVFVSPVYYFSFTAQIKACIDRTYCMINYFKQHRKKVMLITASGASYEGLTDGILASYREMCKYLNWENCGIVGAFGCNEPSDLNNTDFEAEAYNYGFRLC